MWQKFFYGKISSTLRSCRFKLNLNLQNCVKQVFQENDPHQFCASMTFYDPTQFQEKLSVYLTRSKDAKKWVQIREFDWKGLKTRDAVLWLQIWFKMASLNSLWDYFTKNWHSNWHWNCNIWKQIRKNHQLDLPCPIFCPILIWCTEAIQFVCKKINTNMTPDLVNCNYKVKIGPKCENKIFNLGKL